MRTSRKTSSLWSDILTVLSALITASVLLAGCMIDRLMAVRKQLCHFDDSFRLTLGASIEVEFLAPVLLARDIDRLIDAPPTAVIESGATRIHRYEFEKLASFPDGGRVSATDAFSVDLRYRIGADGTLLAGLSTSPLPQGLYDEQRIDESDLQAMAAEACNTPIVALGLRREFPIEPGMLENLPSREDAIGALGTPTRVIPESGALVYEYRLRGSDDARHVARLLAEFDDTGHRPEWVEFGFGSFRSHTDVQAATTRLDWN